MQYTPNIITHPFFPIAMCITLYYIYTPHMLLLLILYTYIICIIIIIPKNIVPTFALTYK